MDTKVRNCNSGGGSNPPLLVGEAPKREFATGGLVLTGRCTGCYMQVVAAGHDDEVELPDHATPSGHICSGSGARVRLRPRFNEPQNCEGMLTEMLFTRPIERVGDLAAQVAACEGRMRARKEDANGHPVNLGVSQLYSEITAFPNGRFDEHKLAELCQAVLAPSNASEDDGLRSRLRLVSAKSGPERYVEQLDPACLEDLINTAFNRLRKVQGRTGSLLADLISKLTAGEAATTMIDLIPKVEGGDRGRVRSVARGALTYLGGNRCVSCDRDGDQCAREAGHKEDHFDGLAWSWSDLHTALGAMSRLDYAELGCLVSDIQRCLEAKRPKGEHEPEGALTIRGLQDLADRWPGAIVQIYDLDGNIGARAFVSGAGSRTRLNIGRPSSIEHHFLARYYGVDYSPCLGYAVLVAKEPPKPTVDSEAPDPFPPFTPGDEWGAARPRVRAGKGWV